jgi:asparagine synthase (glutamine-hydrolysing)
MCGILGYSSIDGGAHGDWLEAGVQALRHRGPDDHGRWISEDGSTGFAHTRLAIVDLSPTGHQPMQDHSGVVTITFNGEIYNHHELRRKLEQDGAMFRSTSDTEVLLEAYKKWGAKCLDYLNGMFAFAIHDSRDGRIFCARDRAGEKPFFYHHARGALLFASELKAILANKAVHASINRDALDTYLYMGFVPGERCLLDGFNKLPPGYALEYIPEIDTLKTWRYWAPAEEAAGAAGVDGEALSVRLERLLADAVGRQMEADVPVGVLLSGGVDSSLITALARRHTDDVTTFTIRFPDSRQFDESGHARLIAEHFGTRHVELDAEAASVDLLPLLARQFDEPIIDSSMFPTFLVSKLVRQHCKVALGGDGGDELFGGYIHYPRLLWMARNPGRLPLGLRRWISRGGLALLPVGFKGRNWLAGLGTDFQAGLPLLANYLDSATRRRLLPDLQLGAFAESFVGGRVPGSSDLLQRATLMDFNNYLPGDILVKVDRASMLNSLELRAPFLDHRIVEMSFREVPSDLKASIYGKKILLKKIARRLLPREFDFERKQGFSIPMGKWLSSGPWHDFFRDVLLDKACPYDRKILKMLLSGQDKGMNNAEKLFGLVMLELWRREYAVSYR